MNMAAEATISAITRYPVKGLSAENLADVRLVCGETLPFDRTWAIENGRSGFDPAAPAHLPKAKFLMLMRNERLALLQTRFDEATKNLAILRDGRSVVSGNLDDPTGRRLLEQFFSSFMETDLRGLPRILRCSGHSFSDVPFKCVSIINHASCEDIARVAGQSVDASRFRGNFLVENIPAWSEFDWVGKTIQMGNSKLEVLQRIRRCAATNVDPETAARDMQIPKTLERAFGHMDCGVYARVIKDGSVEVGSKVTV